MEWSLGRFLSMPLMVLVTIGGLVALLIAVTAVSPQRARLVSLVLRFCIWIATLMLFFRFSLVSTERRLERRPLAVLVDRSLSMTLPVSTGRSRWDETLDWLRPDSPWEKLENDFNLLFYSFSDSILPQDRKALLSSAPPSGSETRLQEALGQLAQRTDLAGILVATDGVDSERNVSSNVPILSHKVPIIALYPGDEPNLRDAAVISMRMPEIAYFKNSVKVEAEVEVVGLPKERAIVRLISGQRILTSSALTAASWEGDRATVSLSFIPDQVGPFGLEVEISNYPGEVTYENNREAAVVRVLRDRVRVLHVAGRPEWDVRFLRSYLQGNPNIDLVSFYILRSPTDDPEADQRDLSLIPFPYHELFTQELSNFDLIVFQNFNFQVYFNAVYLANLKQYVSNGGAFVMVGGDLSFGQGNYRNTEIAEILPVRLKDDSAELDFRTFQPRISLAGRRHPVLTGWLDASSLDELSPLWGFHRTAGLQPDAASLLEHQEGHPILVIRQFGKGRSAAILVDSLWRWTFTEKGRESRSYHDLWDRLFRWLVRDPSFSYIRIESPTKTETDQEIELSVHVLDAAYAPLQGVRPSLFVAEATGIEKGIPSAPTNQEGVSQTKVSSSRAGFLRIRAELAGKEEMGYSATSLVVIEPAIREFGRRTVDVPLLKSLALSSGGSSARLGMMDRELLSPLYRDVKVRLIGKRTHPIWDHPLLMIFLLTVCCAEWWFRRRNGGV